MSPRKDAFAEFKYSQPQTETVRAIALMWHSVTVSVCFMIENHCYLGGDLTII